MFSFEDWGRRRRRRIRRGQQAEGGGACNLESDVAHKKRPHHSVCERERWKEEEGRGRVDEDGSTTLSSEVRSNAMPIPANPPMHVVQHKKETRGAIGRSNEQTSILHLKSPWERG